MENKNAAWIVVGVVVLAYILTMPFFGYGGMFGMMYNYNWGGMYIFGSLMMLLFIIALVLLIIWLFKQIQYTGKTGRR